MNRIIDDFHRLYYESHEQTWMNTSWMGVPTWKCPLDLWIYQELLNVVRPDFIVETGTLHGGSALFLACVCDLVGTGRVITIDKEMLPGRPDHRRLTYIHGSSTDPKTVEKVAGWATGRGLVVLDSDHTKEHVLEEMRLYAPFVAVGSYLIVEDTNVNGRPVFSGHGPGPGEAVLEFLGSRLDFAVDRRSEKFLLTFNPGGFLKKTG